MNKMLCRLCAEVRYRSCAPLWGVELGSDCDVVLRMREPKSNAEVLPWESNPRFVDTTDHTARRLSEGLLRFEVEQLRREAPVGVFV